ncbi:hypothetical protein PG996_012645 [Apiospora saccharicola]|uniref:Uncharacterized protein n=1 Tax=Apiospora saccharicola TaxID=335842 RepID=A0ABR1U5Z2_9PEZI
MTATCNVLGPLTTVFTPNPTCVTPMAGFCQSQSCEAWEGQVCTTLPKWNNSYGVMDQSSCWPPYTSGAATTDVAVMGALEGWGFYSPGLSCPAGSTSACSATANNPTGGDFTFQFPLTAGETAVGCCPTSYSCVLDAMGRNTCLRTLRSTLLDVVTCGGKAPPGTTPKTWAATSTTYLNIYAPLIQINWRATDLPAMSTSMGLAGSGMTIAETRPIDSSAPPNANSTNTLAPSGLSNSAYAWIGVGAALGGLIVLGGVIGGGVLLLRRRRGREQNRGEKGGSIELDNDAPLRGPDSDTCEISESSRTRETREAREYFTRSPGGGQPLEERRRWVY